MSKATSLQTYICSPAEAKQLRQMFDGYALSHDDATAQAIDDAGRRWLGAQSPSLQQALARLSAGDDAALLIDGLPSDPTIREGLIDPDVALATKPDRLSEGLLLGAVSQLGYPFGVASEGRGVVNNLCPIRVSRNAVTGLGSRLPLDQHIENAALRRLPIDRATDGLGLIGVCADPSGDPETVVADVRLAFDRLSLADQSVLRDARFRINLPVRWRQPGVDDRVLAPVASGHGREMSFAFAFYGDMVEAIDSPAQASLARFKVALDAVAQRVRVRPGMLLLINNRIASHGRGAFEPAYTKDGAPLRWLQRVFWISDLARLDGWAESARVFSRPPR